MEPVPKWENDQFPVHFLDDRLDRELRRKDFPFGGRYGITEWQKGKTQPGGLGAGCWFTGPPLRVLFDYCSANSDCKILAHIVRRYRLVRRCGFFGSAALRMTSVEAVAYVDCKNGAQ